MFKFEINRLLNKRNIIVLVIFLIIISYSFLNSISNFKKELNVFSKPFDDIKAYELVSFFAFDGGTESKYKFKIEKGSLNYGVNTANKTAIAEFKGSITNWLTANKRKHIDLKALAGQKDYIDAKKYKQYLINNKVLNTDAILNEPIFQGITNVYISQNIQKKDGKEEKTLKNILNTPKQ